MKSKILKATALFLAEIRIFLKNKLSFDEKKTIPPIKRGISACRKSPVNTGLFYVNMV